MQRANPPNDARYQAIRPCYVMSGATSLSSATEDDLAVSLELAPPSAHVCTLNQTCFTDVGLPLEYRPIVAVFNRTISFDHAGAAYYAVFLIGTMEGWTEVMAAVSDAEGGAATPIFFVTFVLFGGYLLLSMIVGALTGFYIQQSEFAKNESLRAKKHAKRLSQKIASDQQTNKQWKNALTKVSAVSAFADAGGIQPHGGREHLADFIDTDDLGHERRPSLMQQVWTGTFFLDTLNKDEEARGRSMTPANGEGGEEEAPGCLERLIATAVFKWAVLLTILVNAVFLALDHYPQSQAWSDMLRIANYVFVGLFVVEMMLKIAALGCTRYARKLNNCFDWFITVAGVIELLVMEVGKVDNSVSIMAFRSFRLLRVLRLSSDWENLRSYTAGAVRAFRALGSLLMLILLFLVVTSLVGMQLFGGKYWSRTNFDRFDNALLTSFIMQTCSDWNEVMYEGIQVLGGGEGPSAIAGMYFIAVVAFGHYILFGVLLAIAYKNLDVSCLQRSSSLSYPILGWLTRACCSYVAFCIRFFLSLHRSINMHSPVSRFSLAPPPPPYPSCAPLCLVECNAVPGVAGCHPGGDPPTVVADRHWLGCVPPRAQKGKALDCAGQRIVLLVVDQRLPRLVPRSCLPPMV